jgi:N-acetylglucosaminyldiphosphoundecaprenol N-acetyl-beta-D-mannosaminyltransferase
MASVRVLGVRIDGVGMDETVDRIEAMIAAGGAHQVATVNPEFIMRARQDSEFSRVLEAADLCLADGAGAVWAARRHGLFMAERVAGVDLVPALSRRAAARGWGVFLLGGASGVAELAARRLKQLAPELRVVGCFAGDASPAGDDETRAAVARARPDLLLVAYGAPKQELWIERNARGLGVPVSIGVGGAFDFLAGRVPRAPAWMRRFGIEWLFRLIRQPWRARRMAVLPGFALLVLRQRD